MVSAVVLNQLREIDAGTAVFLLARLANALVHQRLLQVCELGNVIVEVLFLVLENHNLII